jgi:3-deoxy-D-manno-octulosonic-acid transferase
MVHPTGATAIWFHAVSVGEVLSVVELLRVLRAARPHLVLYVSTATIAGRRTAEQRLVGLADLVFFVPLDYRSTVRRTLRRLRPKLVVVMETEIWPNLYREVKRAGATLLVVNGRISERALPRYKQARGFFTHVLRWPDTIYVQSNDDAKRYVLGGAPAVKVKVAGNLKYDFRPPAGGIAPEIAEFLDKLGDKLAPLQIWVAASTMPPFEAGDVDEDDAVIRAFQEIAPKHPGLLLILAPRKPDRFEAIAGRLKEAQIPFVRRTRLSWAEHGTTLPFVLLLDTIGELAALFERATVVFMGGTLAKRGGHNILEPAFFGKPVIAGPHMENFAEIAREFTAAKALERIPDPKALGGAVASVLDDPKRASQLGERSRQLAISKRGVVSRVSLEILRATGEGVPDPARTLLARMFFTPLSWLWGAGHRWNLARGIAARKSLQTRVVSIGGLSMGGVGKTPLVEHIARYLTEAGRNPAILTRGYRRKSAAPTIVIPKGQPAAIELTGDEAQMFVDSGIAHVGIGADRWEVGHRLESELHPDVFLLDDGFQHVRLARDENIVLVDALNPLAGGLFPLGRRREPLESLKRATAIVITRVDRLEDQLEVVGIERLVRRYNARAPIFRCRVVPREWVELDGGVASALANVPFRRVAAFCGLGAPQSFWNTLAQLNLDVVCTWAFDDHHAYKPEDLRRLRQQAQTAGAEVLVTTEKDIMNLREGAAQLAAPVKIYWLKIGVELDREKEFLARIL